MKLTCLTIAGFDGSGGAGIQADTKTFSATGTYGTNVVTAIAVQNTCGVRSCHPISLACIQAQLEAIFDDIRPDAIKIGMLFSAQIIEQVSSFLQKAAHHIPIVLDPVMVAKSGDHLLEKDAIDAMKTHCIPIVDILTPNLPEAKTLLPNHEDKIGLAHGLLDLGCRAVLLKGGHEVSLSADDLYMTHHMSEMLTAPRIISNNTHGTGCTLSAAITSYLAQGFSPLEACKKAKTYLYNAMRHSQHHRIGKGHGPVHHFYHLWQYL